MKACPTLEVQSSSAPSREEFAAARALLSQRTIPELIDLLESFDLRTRFLAEMCLRDATNT
ncbi:MAG: hypothetical protein ABW208_05680 [Pyrinomonadaceae bacterium]